MLSSFCDWHEFADGCKAALPGLGRPASSELIFPLSDFAFILADLEKISERFLLNKSLMHGGAWQFPQQSYATRPARNEKK
jgi:hypothetical protein